MNKKQRLVLAIIVPIIVIVIAIGWSDNVGFAKDGFNGFDWEDTWYIWALAVSAIGASTYCYFKE